MAPAYLNIVILAGGGGTRLWPMSTDAKPKQFQSLVSNKTMLQDTFERVNFVPIERIFVSTSEKYAALVKEQIPDLPEENLILEPSRQDTGPAMGLAAALIQKRQPDAVLAMISSDHLVQDANELQEKISAAAEIAHVEKTLNIIEVRVKSPHTGLGYVEIGEKLGEIHGHPFHSLKAFIEKPNLEKAKEFANSPHYLWNTGYYVWRADTLLKAFQEQMPKTYAALKAIQEGASLAAEYSKCDKISIDYGIMEKVDPKLVRIIPADLGWSDIGSWASLHEELASSPEANLKKGRVFELENTGCLMYNETQTPLVTFGLKDLVIVQTAHHTLICPKERSGDLKKLLEHYEKEGN